MYLGLIPKAYCLFHLGNYPGLLQDLPFNCAVDVFIHLYKTTRNLPGASRREASLDHKYLSVPQHYRATTNGWFTKMYKPAAISQAGGPISPAIRFNA
jgi:hypothetical protein